MSSPQLMQAFDFTPEELRVNQSGQLSPRQQTILDQIDIQQTLDIGCVFIVFGGVGMLIFFACALFFNLQAVLSSLINILPLIAVLVVGFLIMAVVYHFKGRQERINQPDVLALEGTITLKESDGGFNARQFLIISEHEFRITPQMYDTLKQYPEATRYRVYYSQVFNKILSIEAESDYQ
jgi:hypothetical protein